ncbi:hypothetical protein MmiAt1_07760 [Methanimicrococcus sp. At1]|uniref:Type II toxin-antitoxin system HicA family toxin n=1 Tax=Methanimicrococcus hacksteinii TaxID=3028293 RepID=A0ABU3VP76_9EURY|nr:hypothetical protein [Methanimicrococcus sp. At1]MDV0445219.1 hypothetical protein [Methanimicrococcus sp. At1]
MAYKCRKIEGALTKKGFTEIRDGDHKYYIYYDEAGKTFVKTKTSHNNQDYHSSLINAMSKQLKLKPEQFAGVVECTISKDELKSLYAGSMPQYIEDKQKYLDD